MAARGRPWLATAGLAVLAVVAAGLSYLALTTNTSSPSSVPSARRATASPSDSPSVSPSGSPSKGSATSDLTRPAAVVGLVSPTNAWRASGGSCTTSTSSTVERTSDGGADWVVAASPGMQVLGVTAVSARGVTVIGLDPACAVRQAVTTDGGRTWSPQVAPSGVWAMNRATSTSPAGAPRNACGGGLVVGLDAVAPPGADDALDPQVAYVLCADGAVRRTTDGGATFTTQSTVEGAEAIAADAGGITYLAVPGTADCAGVNIKASGDDASTWNDASCVLGATDTNPIALDALDSTLMLRSGGRTYVSTDGAATWTTVDG